MNADHLAAAVSSRAAAAVASRLDIVIAAHKATRRFMFDTLVRIGSVDVTDGDDIDRALNLLDRLFDVLCEPQDGWQATKQMLRCGAASERRGALAALYRDLAALVSRRLVELQSEEVRLQALSPVQPLGARLKRLSDEELRAALYWMEAALTPQELAALLDELHAASSADRFHDALALLSERLDERRWNQLARALGMSQSTPNSPTATPQDALLQCA